MTWTYKPVAERFPELSRAERAGRAVVGSAAEVIGGLGAGINQLNVGALKALDDHFGEYHPNLRRPFEAFRDFGNSVQEWGTEVKAPIQAGREKYQNRGFTDLATDWNYLTDPAGLWTDAFEGVGSSLPFMAVGGGLLRAGVAPASFVGGKVANLLGKTKAGQKLLDLGKQAYGKRIGGVLGDMASGGANYGLTTAPMDALTNSAELIKPLKDRGFNDSEIAQLMSKAALRELPMDIAANALQGNILFGKGLGLFGKTWKGRLGYGSLNIPLEMELNISKKATKQRMFVNF